MPTAEMPDFPISFTLARSVLDVRDEIAEKNFQLRLDSDPRLEPALPDLFHFPVDGAVSFSVGEFTVNSSSASFLRDDTGRLIGPATDVDSLGRGTYYLEISATVKAYIRLPDVELSLTHLDDPFVNPFTVTLSEETRVTVGARSLHDRPAATIVVPDDPSHRAEAISYLGSAIKEYSPERSWPNLRGHPPRFVRGPELELPSELERPETGIRITVPANDADLYRIAPLAYYLGATVQIGETPAMHLPNGYTEPLTTRRHSLEETVTRLVSKCFLLDVLARQGGYIPIPTPTYDTVSPHLSFIPEDLAEESLTTQLMEYLEAPTEPVLDALPRWTSTAILRPHADDVTLIPYLLDSMARIRVADSPPTPSEVRASDPSRPYAVAYSHPVAPAGGVSLCATGFENHLASDAPQVDEAVVALVTSDPENASDLRTSLADAPFRERPSDIDVIERPSTDALSELFRSTADLLVLDLPASEGVLSCADGPLDVTDIPDAQPRAVVVDSAHADTETLRALVEAGATSVLAAPSVTTAGVGLRLLGCLLTGHTLSSASDLVFPETDCRIAGVPLGDVLRLETGMEAGFSSVTRSAEGYDVTAEIRPTAGRDLGSTFRSSDIEEAGHHLHGSTVRIPEPFSAEDVAELCNEPPYVVVLDGVLYAHEMNVTDRFGGEISGPAGSTSGVNRAE